MYRNDLKTILFFCLLVVLSGLPSGQTFGQTETNPTIGLAPDLGFPIWLTPDAENYMPLVADQTSGLDWIATDYPSEGEYRDWLVAIDDADRGGIHLIGITDGVSGPKLSFAKTELTIPPPAISGIPLESGHGYDWEAIALHPWSKSVLLMHEGSQKEIALYIGKTTSGDTKLSSGAIGRTGPENSLPGHISNIRPLKLPDWDATLGKYFKDNMGIEGIACTKDRIFVGLESPYDFADRMLYERSTILAIWSINPDDPSDMENCKLLQVHDTSQWKDALGFTIETICGLDALDNNHLVGIDRDNTRLFAVEFNDAGMFTGGRVFFLDVPGPAPLPSDGCPPTDALPRLIRPSLESVAVVPYEEPGCPGEIANYRVYLAVDPWNVGWQLLGHDWKCSKYEERLKKLLPALYRYTVTSDTLFPH
jgi:hypothetical protein